MRWRLRITYVSLLAAVLVGLNLPLATTLAARTSQTMFIDRLNDTARFAALAEPALRTGRAKALDDEMRQYDRMYDIAVAIVGRDGRPVLATREALDVGQPSIFDHVEAALSGQHAALAETVWPWHDGPLVVAAPVRRGGEIIGAVVTVSPTDALREGTGWRLAILAGASLLVLLIGAATAGPLARWMLRPVEDLGDAVQALSEGRFEDRVAVASGPPELRGLAASFNRMAERIATLVERQRSFVSYASHQLRTPLATLRLCVDNLRPSVRADGDDDYVMLADEINRMGQMCDALLAYARAEVTPEELAEIDAAAVADERVGVWRSIATEAGVRLHRTGIANGTAVQAAPQALDQSLDALLSNAIKFAGRGADVVVAVGSNGAGWVDVHVVDNGPGMPAADLARASQPFWRRTEDQNIDGSGLGVTIADSLVSASGGQLDLMPVRPHGVHARIRLRAVAGKPAATAASPAAAGPTA